MRLCEDYYSYICGCHLYQTRSQRIRPRSTYPRRLEVPVIVIHIGCRGCRPWRTHLGSGVLTIFVTRPLLLQYRCFHLRLSGGRVYCRRWDVRLSVFFWTSLRPLCDLAGAVKHHGDETAKPKVQGIRENPVIAVEEDVVQLRLAAGLGSSLLSLLSRPALLLPVERLLFYMSQRKPVVVEVPTRR